jgi:gliding motility-associated protein GldE
LLHHLIYIATIDRWSQLLLLIQTQGLTFLGVLLLLLVLLSFGIAGNEVALFSLQRKELDVLKTKQQPSSKRIVKLMEEPKEVYASLLITGTFVNICIILLANFLLTSYMSMPNLPNFLSLIIRALIIVVPLVFFGRVLPKVWATQHNLRFAHDWSFLAMGLHLMMRKISFGIVRLANGIGKGVGADKSEADRMQELDEAIDIKTDDEVSPEEKKIMKGVVKFGNISVKQIMKSRLYVSGVEYQTSFSDLLKKVEELHYSRIPVFKGSLDEITGILNTKDLIPHLQKGNDFDWHTLLRQPYFVPESKLIEDLLKEFQQRRTHFAVVVDEFGGTSGIITMEDILEEVIGDIRDEFDEEETEGVKLDDNTYVFEGRTMLFDVCRAMKLPQNTFDEVKGESDSLAGLILELAGELPVKDQLIPCGDFEFQVLEIIANRVQSVKVSITMNLQKRK